MRRFTVVLALSLVAAPAASRAQDTAPHPVDDAAATLDRLVPHVEAECGREFPEPPRIRLLSIEAARAAFADDLRFEVERRYPDATDGQRRALLAASARTSVASCIARYSFSARAIVLVRDSFDVQRAAAGFAEDEAADLLAAVLAHEAVHALDDAHHDLADWYRAAPDAEALRARAMVAEGRAVTLGRRAAAAAGIPERARALLPGGPEPDDLHAWLLRLTYEAGAAFVARLEEDGETRGSERALAEPPRTTHQVFHPERWPEEPGAPEPARRLAAAGLAEGAHALSELQLRARYAALHGPETAERLFAGFRGGAQALASETNVAVLAFVDAEAASRYVALAGEEAPTVRDGVLVLRAFGPAAEALLERVQAAATHDGRRDDAD